MKKVALILLFATAALGSFSQTKKPVPAKQPIIKNNVASAKEVVQEEEPITPIKAEPGKEVVAVYHFTVSRGYNYEYAEGVGNAVEAGVVRSGRFTVVERNRFGIIKEEEKFKEANTGDMVKKAAKFGAKTLITGHVVGVSKGELVDSYGKNTGREYVEISLSFKIIDVETGEIKKSEIISGKGEERTEAGATQAAYLVIDKLLRAHVAHYLPQRFKFMSVAEKGMRKKVEYLAKFKIWGGSDNGLKVGDVVEIYEISWLENPDTHAKVQEKRLLAKANILEVNSGSTATCEVIDGHRLGNGLLQMANTSPEKVVLEYEGNWYGGKRTLLDILAGD